MIPSRREKTKIRNNSMKKSTIGFRWGPITVHALVEANCREKLTEMRIIREGLIELRCLRISLSKAGTQILTEFLLMKFAPVTASI